MRAIVAHGDPDARRRLVRALRDADVVVVAEAHGGREAVELTVYYRPDVVLLAVIPLQVLAYCIARKRGLNVDQPRNLAKTVTVE